jgi:hypothetical protein
MGEPLQTAMEECRVIHSEPVNATRLAEIPMHSRLDDVSSHGESVLLTFSTVESLPYTVEHLP